MQGDQDIMVHGDSVIEITYSEETKKIIDKVFERTKGLGGLFKEYFMEQKHPQMKIELKITKNPQLADLIRKQVMGHFVR